MELTITLNQAQRADVASKCLHDQLLKLLEDDLAAIDIHLQDYEIKLVNQNVVLEYIGMDADVVGRDFDYILRNAREEEIAIFTCLDLLKV
ncbi:hypothetical protein [Pseudoalteromonas spongiae]|uniref:hypothetical protein n=1 Tax=Pseudoalteromonas spongiae TaxID=298657 RepID=UPI000C2D0733|nr:hypothetical protein [Pseudoalteromonas spongiae]